MQPIPERAATSRGATLRAVRAAHHLDDIQGIIATYRRDHPSPTRVLIPKDQLGTGSFRPIFEWDPLAEAPRLEIAIRVGEFAYNLRAALDYLVHQLAKLDRAPRQIRYFPIDDDPENWERRRRTWLKGIDDDHVEVIRRHQPFSGNHWLSLLKAINNPDKHESVIGVASQSTGEFAYHDDRLRPVPDRDDVVELIQDAQTLDFQLLGSLDLTAGLHILLFEMSRLLNDFRPLFGDEDSFEVNDPGVTVSRAPGVGAG